MKPRKNEVGTYNPYKRKYEAVLTFEEISTEALKNAKPEPEEYQGDIRFDKHPELSDGALLPKNEQPATYLNGKWVRAGYEEEEDE